MTVHLLLLYAAQPGRLVEVSGTLTITFDNKVSGGMRGVCLIAVPFWTCASRQTSSIFVLKRMVLLFGCDRDDKQACASTVALVVGQASVIRCIAFVYACVAWLCII